MKNKYSFMAALLLKYFKGDLNDREQQILGEWLSFSDRHRCLLDTYTNKDNLLREVMFYNSIDREVVWKKLVKKIPALAVVEIDLPDAKI